MMNSFAPDLQDKRRLESWKVFVKEAEGIDPQEPRTIYEVVERREKDDLLDAILPPPVTYALRRVPVVSPPRSLPSWQPWIRP